MKIHPVIMAGGSGTRWAAYALATGLSAAFVGLRLALEPWLQGQAPLLVLLAAPIFAACSTWIGWRTLATRISVLKA